MWIFNFVVKPLGFVNDQQKGGNVTSLLYFMGMSNNNHQTVKKDI